MVIGGGIYEALELRDGEKRLLGKGVLQAEQNGRECLWFCEVVIVCGSAKETGGGTSLILFG